VGALVDRYESHLARSEARNRTLVQNSAPILVVDRSGAILDANPQAEGLFRAPVDRLLHMDLRDLWLPDHRENVEDLLRTVASTGVVERVDFDMRASDGRGIPVDLRACRIDYEGRDAVYLLVRDISESRRARDEILQANRKLRELDRLKTDFLNAVSHELRTPLTSIRWSTESLVDLATGDGTEKVQKLLGIIRDDVRRLSVLIEQLLGFSRLDAGELKPLFQKVDLAPLLQRAVGELVPIAQKKGVVLAPVPAAGALEMEADPDQVLQVLVNLVDNAVKYTSSEGEVALEARPTDGWVKVEVRDTGIGIPEEEQERIFEKFYRTDQADVRGERGTGLGLAIVKGIVDAHGGDIGVESRVGAGSTFTIRLPRTQGRG
jgi:PAS domain S-box-containing protein